MRKSRKTQKLEEFKVEQEIVRRDVKGEPFDVVILFQPNNPHPEIYMDENVKMVLEALTDRYGKIIVKFNWWNDGVMVIAPDTPPADVRLPDIT